MDLLRFRSSVLSFIVLCGVPFFSSGAVQTTLEAPSAVLKPDEGVTLSLLLTNDADAPATQTVPAGLGLVARLGLRAEAFTLARVSGEPSLVTIAPKSYARIAYSGALPAGMAGFVVLQDGEGRFGAVALQINHPDKNTDATATSPASTPASAIPAASAIATATATSDSAADPVPAGSSQAPRRSASDLGLMAYEPIYFSVGDGGGLNARFQFSLKYRPFGPGNDRIAGEHWWQDVYFAFTQTSVWDLHSESNPFYDSSYRPSISYGRHEIGPRFLGAAFGYSAGLEHESNGKDGADSRSINTAFLRPELRWGNLDERNWLVTFSPKFYVYLEKDDNEDIAHYRGYGDYALSVEWKNSFKIATTTRIGTHGHASFLIDASYPFNRINDLIPIGWVHGYLHLQFFNGYGETILDYNRRDDTQIRLGFMLVR
ncbi:phospholipase [Opitutaceae bacterium TAV4]|nr:phospholipase [Opitutaceae bacterium TAV4]RRJ99580.1 phospholipase [Opitutaceae bacterium TAV3]